MYITPLAPGIDDGFLAFCDRRCVQAWADDDPDDELVALTVPATTGPPWCMHCHTCGQRCWTHPACPLCPDCEQPHWTRTYRAAAFALVLARYSPDGPLADAYEQGEQLCETGLEPGFAALVIARRAGK